MKIPNIKARPVLLICLTSFIILFSAGCKKDDNTSQKTPPATVTGPYLYIAGGDAYSQISLSATKPTPIVHTLKNASSVSSIVTSGKDVYVAAQTAGYYKNDVFVPLTNATTIQYLAVSDTTVFAAGIDNAVKMAYWQNNTETTLSTSPPTPGPPGSMYTGLSGITVSGGNVYVSGAMNFSRAAPVPPADTIADPNNYGVLWTNGSGIQYYGPTPGQVPNTNSAAIPGYTTVGVAVVGNDVYVAGIIPDYTLPGGYWKNGTFSSINNGAFHPLAILSAGNDLYITGYTYTGSGTTSYATQGVYWKNGTLINFPLAVGINAIAVNGTDLYLLGVDSNDNYVVWKNGAVFETLGSASGGTGIYMAIGD